MAKKLICKECGAETIERGKAYVVKLPHARTCSEYKKNVDISSSPAPQHRRDNF